MANASYAACAPDDGLHADRQQFLAIVTDAYFSTSYVQARQRFIDAAQRLGAERYAYPVHGAAGGELTIDVAILGSTSAPALVVSSGIHGVEGFFGSAVQLALLQQLHTNPLRNRIRWVIVHALNPYGFAHLRRVNEHNVDLNRNFMPEGEPYAGSPARYGELDAFLNPPSAPPRFEAFRVKALAYIRRYGLQALKDTIAGGQHDYPRGLFYGGNAPCASTCIVQAHGDAWLADARHCLHLDLHTGLGKFAQCTLLLNEPKASPQHAWYADTFGTVNLESLQQAEGTAYQITGLFSHWMQQHFSARDYRCAGVEFGTYDAIRIVAALRAENRAHHHCAPGDPAMVRSKKELRECFCPRSTAWRDTTVGTALNIIARGAGALTGAAT